MFHLLALNAQRAGAIAGMTLRSLDYAQERPDGKRIIVVSDHKTGYRTPATLVATGELWSALRNYIKVRKLHVESEQPELSLANAKVFLTHTRQPLSVSNENSGINSFLEAGLSWYPRHFSDEDSQSHSYQR